jgi:hypothetical protein
MLQQLPEELLDQILYHVATFPLIHDPQVPWEEPQNSWIPHQCRSTLLDICLVFKTLYRLALPHLYKPFSNHAERESRVRNSPTPELPGRIISPLHNISVRYLRTLCARPDYGSLLTSLSFSMKNPLMAFVPRVTSHEEHADLALFSKTAQDFWFGATWTEMVQQKLAAGLLAKMPDATMCLVLLMCPNIETWEIVGENEQGIHRDPLCDSLLTFLLVVTTAQVFSSIAPDELLQRSLILQRVQTLTLAVRPLRLIWPELMAVFSLPALRTLRIRNLCTMYAGRVAPLRVITSRRLHYREIRSLELHWISIPGSCVAKLLRWCPNLTMLDVTWDHLTGVHFRDYECAFHEVGKAVSEYNPLLVSLKLIDSGLAVGEVASRLCFTLRDLQHLTHVHLGSQSVWCHPSNQVDAINDNLPDSIESLFIAEGARLPDNLPINGSPSDGDSRFDVACVADPSSPDGHKYICQCRTRDIRRLLLDERLTRLRRVAFSTKSTIATREGEKPFHKNENDPHVLRHILTPAVRRRGWKLSEKITHAGRRSFTDPVLYRGLTDGFEDVPTMSECGCSAEAADS